MDSDLGLVIGLLLVGLSIPSIVNAYSEKSFPRWSLAFLVCGGALIFWAHITHSGGYTLAQIPDVIIHVIARFI